MAWQSMETTASGRIPEPRRAGRLVSVAIRKAPSPLALATAGRAASREGPAAVTTARRIGGRGEAGLSAAKRFRTAFLNQSFPKKAWTE